MLRVAWRTGRAFLTRPPLPRPRRGPSRNAVAEIYDAMDKKTFGQILQSTRNQTGIPADLNADLEAALNKRNYLAHRFFVAHDVDIRSPEGRRKMIDELRDVVACVKQLDAKMDPVWIAAWERLGVTQEWVNKQLARLQAAEAESTGDA